MMTFGKLAKEITNRETKKSPRGVNLNIAEVSEVLRHALDILAVLDFDQVATLMRNRSGGRRR